MSSPDAMVGPAAAPRLPARELSSPPLIAMSASGHRLVRVVGGVAYLGDQRLADGTVAVAVLDGAVWLVCARDGGHALCRFDDAGGALGEPLALGALGPPGRPVAIAATRSGARHALIEGEHGDVEIRDRGELQIDPLGCPHEGRRVLLGAHGVFERRGELVAPCHGGHAAWPLPADVRGAVLAGGALIFDGAAALAVLDARAGRHVVVYDPRTRALRFRARIGDARVLAIAERRGTVLLGSERHLAVLDPRTGRCSHERIVAGRVAGAAVACDGQRYAVMLDDGDVLELGAALGELAAHRVRISDGRHAALDDARQGAPPDEALADVPGAGREHELSASRANAPEGAPATASVAAPENGWDGGAENARVGGAENAWDDGREAARRAPAAAAAGAPVLGDAMEVRGPDAAAEALVAPPVLRALGPAPAASLPPAAAAQFLEDLFALVSAWCRAASADHPRDRARERAREQAATSRVVRWNGAATPIAALGAELGLSPLARSILVVAAAPRLWGELAARYAAIAGDPSRPLVDEMLVCRLLDVRRADRHRVASELDETAPLVRHGLVALTGRPRPFALLDVPGVVVQRILGRCVDDPADPVRRVGDTALAALIAPCAPLAALVEELARPAARPVRIALRGRDGAGRRTIAAALAARVGRALGLIELAAGPTGDSVAALRRELRDAHLRGRIACVSGLGGAIAADPAAAGQLRAVLEAHPGPLVVRCDPGEEPPLAPGHLALELPPPALDQGAAAWRDALARHGQSTDLAAQLAERFAVGPGVAHRVAAELPAGAAAGDLVAQVERRLAQRRAERMARLATRVDRLPPWSALVLPDDVLDSVREIVARVRLRARVLDGWGMGEVASTGRAITALFQGGPGTGKTMVAGAIARELGFELYRVDLSRITSKWLGETEKHLAALFDAAEEGPCILLFDEADSLFGKRTQLASSHDRNANLEVNYLLQRLDSFDGIAILTTNFGTAIDPAFKRRLSLLIQFPFPDETERERLWRAHLPAQLPVSGDLDLPGLARKFQLSGGYIRNAALRAAYLAAAEQAPVTAEHLRRAVAAEYRDQAKLNLGGVLT